MAKGVRSSGSTLMPPVQKTISAPSSTICRIVRVMQKLEALQEDRSFWNHTADGLAVLAEKDDIKTFHLEKTMPQRVWVDT